MRDSNIETEEQNLIYSESQRHKDNKSDKQRKSILKNGGYGINRHKRSYTALIEGQ